MASLAEVSNLLAKVIQEHRVETSLDMIANMSLSLTHSRNSMIAILDDEIGRLMINHGAGKEWLEQESAHSLTIDTAAGKGIVAFVAATGRTFHSGNVHIEPHYKNLFDTTISEIATPIVDKYGRIRAVLNVESEKPDAYTEQDRETCEAIALIASVCLDLEDAHRREEALIEIGNGLDKALTEEDLLQSVIYVAGNVLRFGAFSVFLYDKATTKFLLRGSVGRLHDKVGIISYEADDGCTGWVCGNGKPIRLDNPQEDPRWRGKHVEFPGEQIASFLAVPILVRGKCAGAMRAVRRVTDNKFLDNRFTHDDQRILQAIAEQFATGLEKIRSMEKHMETERMAAWGELSARSSHMIGNRVFALRGDVNELGHILKGDSADHKALEEIQSGLSRNVSRIEEILQEFRDFVTATQLHRTASDLNALVSETAKEVFPRRSEIKLVISLDPSIPQIEIDAGKLRRAISEIIENALLHTESGAIKITTSFAVKYAFVEITDTGKGVPEEKKSSIFEPFFTTRVKGMGLGLSIVKGIIEAHGGLVNETGDEGLGARFVIRLPVAERPL